MTWKGPWTGYARDPDSLEDALAELVKAAQRDVERAGRREAYRGELIEGPVSVSFILLAPGRRLGDFAVRVRGGRLEVRARGMRVSRKLGCPVDPSTARTTCVNGVLSVKLGKRL